MDVEKSSLCLMFIFFNCGFFTVDCQQQNGMEDADAYLTTPQLNDKYGYDAEIHSVVTDDGYILEMHRIAGLKNRTREDRQKQKPVVFLMHGMGGDSSNWCLFGLHRGLAYHLSNEGFDVWSGNARGNDYSKAHKSLLPNQKAFWDFSWHEIGYYDLPAMIDYILQRSKQQQINYIGYSQGGAAFYVMCATRPEYNSKISLFQGLGPASFMKGSKLFLRMSQFTGLFEIFTKMMGIGMLPATSGSFKNDTIKYFIENKRTQLHVNIVRLINSNLQSPIEVDMLPIIFGHVGNNLALRQVYHFGQLIESGSFQHYDYGARKNKELYGTEIAPDYDTSKIKVPIILLSGLLDTIVPPDQVKMFSLLLPNLVEYRELSFNHVEFISHIEIRQELHNAVVENAVKYKTCHNCFS